MLWAATGGCGREGTDPEIVCEHGYYFADVNIIVQLEQACSCVRCEFSGESYSKVVICVVKGVHCGWVDLLLL